MLEAVSIVGGMVRGSMSQPFGGIQVIACGDFLQLPPVGDRHAYTSTEWVKTFKKTYELRHVHRQKDPTFINLLNEIRIGAPSRDTIGL
jgi:ATP-dependent DNA helicase PIF1